MKTVLLDTNVLAEATRPRPDPQVLARLEEAEDTAAMSVVTWHELLYGVRRLPAGRRRNALRDLVMSLPDRLPLLSYDRAAAEWHASERARLEATGSTPTFADGQIAATAAVNGLRLVTRNLKDFAGFTGLAVESWWR